MDIEAYKIKLRRFLDTTEKLSIAIELKFVVPFLPSGAVAGDGGDSGDSDNSDDSDDQDEPPLEVAKHIESAGAVAEEDKVKLWEQAFSSLADAIGSVPGQRALTSYDVARLRMRERDCWAKYWVVKKSNSAEPAMNHPHRDDYLWVPVEVNSPKMAWKDPKTIRTMKSVLDAMSARYRLVSNYTCETHVHVGRMDGRAFTLPTLKRIAMLLWLSEPILRSVKDPASPNFEHLYTWSSAARKHSRLAADLRSGKVAHAPAAWDLQGQDGALSCYLSNHKAKPVKGLNALRLIASTRTHVELGQLLSGVGRPYRRLGFNFSAFGGEDDRALTNPRTVECRFLEGQIAHDVVLGWVRIFSTMVEAGLDEAGSGGRFLKTVQRLVDEEDGGLGQRPHAGDGFGRLMEDLGVEEEAYRPVQAMVRNIHRESQEREKEPNGYPFPQ